MSKFWSLEIDIFDALSCWFPASLMFISRWWFPVSEGRYLLKSTVSMYENNSIYSKLYILSGSLIKYMCFDVDMYGEGHEKYYSLHYIFNLITSTGNRESKEEASSLFALGDCQHLLEIYTCQIRELYIIQSNSVSAYAKPFMVFKMYWIFLLYKCCWSVERALGITLNNYVEEMFHCSINLFKLSWIIPKCYSERL